MNLRAPKTRGEAITYMRELLNKHDGVIPTKHDGVIYRSRTEARWAVFFGTLGIGFYYEEQGFITDEQGYLPDFHLPGERLIAEVKSSFDADPDGVQKLRNLVAARGKERGVVLPAIAPGEVRLLLIGPDGQGETWEDDRGMWLTCPLGYHYDVQPYPQRGCQECRLENDYWYESDEITNAYEVARSYRFGR